MGALNRRGSLSMMWTTWLVWINGALTNRSCVGLLATVIAKNSVPIGIEYRLIHLIINQSYFCLG